MPITELNCSLLAVVYLQIYNYKLPEGLVGVELVKVSDSST